MTGDEMANHVWIGNRGYPKVVDGTNRRSQCGGLWKWDGSKDPAEGPTIGDPIIKESKE